MSRKKTHIVPKKKKSSKNPFFKMFEDKLRIQEALQKGESLSSLKDIKFVKPI
jgi:hypothetical protein